MLYRPQSLSTSLLGKSLFKPEQGGLLTHPVLFVFPRPAQQDADL
jgi:hypothetical protein